MPQSAPIAGESEEKDVSDAIPKEDGEKRPTPNAGFYSGGSGWFAKIQRENTVPPGWAAAVSPAVGMPPEGSPSVPVKDSQRSPAIRTSSPSTSPSFRK